MDTTILDLSKCALVVVPENLLKLTAMAQLYLSDNRLSSLPADMFVHLPHLRYLDLRFNRLFNLPTTIGKCNYLRTLLLTDNMISALPGILSVKQI